MLFYFLLSFTKHMPKVIEQKLHLFLYRHSRLILKLNQHFNCHFQFFIINLECTACKFYRFYIYIFFLWQDLPDLSGQKKIKPSQHQFQSVQKQNIFLLIIFCYCYESSNHYKKRVKSDCLSISHSIVTLVPGMDVALVKWHQGRIFEHSLRIIFVQFYILQFSSVIGTSYLGMCVRSQQ